MLPLFAGGRLLGAIAVDATRSGRRLSPADLELVRLLASRTAIALDNCRLYGEIQDRDRQKDTFLAMLSHELRNPLGAIAMAVRVLDAVGSPDQRAVRACEVVRRQSAHLARMVDDLLDVARVASGRIGLTLVPLRLDEVIERVLTDLRVAGRLERHALEVRAMPVLVNGDSTRLEQVVTNLLLNALKYTDPGGRIDVEVAEAEGEAVLRVRDSGIGISADLLPRVFDLFAQGGQTLARAQGGLGIGLTLVRLLVEQQGGRVQAWSDGPGRGSLFTLWLPRLRLAGETAESSGAPDRGVAALRILVVEDNDDARGMLRTLLELNGHEVHEACDGEEGLAQVLRLMPQVAFIDLGLPGADGLAVAAAIRQTGPGERMVLVALTGYGEATDRRKTREAGFDEHLVKPVELERVTEVLARARGSRADLGQR